MQTSCIFCFVFRMCKKSFIANYLLKWNGSANENVRSMSGITLMLGNFRSKIYSRSISSFGFHMFFLSLRFSSFPSSQGQRFIKNIIIVLFCLYPFFQTIFVLITILLLFCLYCFFWLHIYFFFDLFFCFLFIKLPVFLYFLLHFQFTFCLYLSFVYIRILPLHFTFFVYISILFTFLLSFYVWNQFTVFVYIFLLFTFILCLHIPIRFSILSLFTFRTLFTLQNHTYENPKPNEKTKPTVTQFILAMMQKVTSSIRAHVHLTILSAVILRLPSRWRHG